MKAGLSAFVSCPTHFIACREVDCCKNRAYGSECCKPFRKSVLTHLNILAWAQGGYRFRSAQPLATEGSILS